MKQKTIFFLIISSITFKGLSQIEGKYTFKENDNQCYKERSIIEYDDNINFYCKEDQAHLYLNKIITRVRDYIIDRTNSEFYNNLKINHAEISIDNFEPKKEDYSKFHKHWYWINYTCKIKETFYSFAFRFDEEGKMIENLNFPGDDNQINVDKIINPKAAIKKARSIEKSLKHRKLSVILKYLEGQNLFCYVIKKDPKVQKNLKKNLEFISIYQKVFISMHIPINL